MSNVFKPKNYDYDNSQSFGIIGWREFVTLPQLEINQIKAKIDTGARSSALHAFNIRELSQNGKRIIRFQVHPVQRNSKTTKTTQAELLEYRKIRNSGGITQLRPVIKTEVKLGDQSWVIELSLTDRDVMGFRMLLGRQAVRNKFLVDPGKSFLQSRRKL
ncbi:MAG TPA: RimK/LysX family protein [Coleofasciculaceae cyanobacterium]